MAAKHILKSKGQLTEVQHAGNAEGIAGLVIICAERSIKK
jgi:hypothetical protein